ncbi:hypothetical protein [Pseudomonas sp. L1(2025)]|uniref:hypothetical protein n=1 Tax=Pseudomonas sp. L1(2025) TaxID=3449429 RepID=UPI003F694D03
MLEDFNALMQTYRLADYASLLGLLASIVGFGITIRTVLTSRAASALAMAAVENMRADLRRGDTVADFATALAIMEEIKRLHRSHSLAYLPDRYSHLRKFLVSIRSSNPLLTDIERQDIQGAIAQFVMLEKYIEKAIDTGEKILPSKMNRLVSKHEDIIQGLLIRVKGQIGLGESL